MKRILIFTLLCAMLFLLCSCGDNGGQNVEGLPTGGQGTQGTSGSGSVMPTDPTDPTNSTTTKVPSEAQVFAEYENLYRIGSFCNGLAPFLVHKNSNVWHFSSEGKWSGDYLLGYIDIEGNVIIKPTYSCNPYLELPAFEYPCVGVIDYNKEQYCVDSLLDSEGNVLFQVNKDGVSAIGTISCGYFWVETYTESVNNVKYTVRYYRASDLEVVATFEDIRAVVDRRTIGGMNSTLTDSGTAILVYQIDKSYYGSDDMLKINIADYDNTFMIAEDSWDVDIRELETFAGASVASNVSTTDNDLGALAAVIAQNSNGTLYYAVVDSEGNVLLEPQRNIEFPAEKTVDLKKYEFRKNLCPAKDPSTGLWGYIDPYGNWVLQAKYKSVQPFNHDGYAVVNEFTVIDVNGNVVLAPN